MEGPAHLTLAQGLPNAQEGEAGVARGRSRAAPEPSWQRVLRQPRPSEVARSGRTWPGPGCRLLQQGCLCQYVFNCLGGEKPATIVAFAGSHGVNIAGADL